MNKELIKKWSKRVGIVIGSIIAICLLYVVSVLGYKELYIPYHIESLYEEGLNNPSKAEWAVKQLQNTSDMDGVAQDKAVTLIKEYAKKETLWAQIALEQYNEEHEIPIKSITPINKHIWGITLGKSTKEDVWNYLDSKGLWHQELENGEVTQVLDDFEFVGVYWNCINYHFVNGIVSSIDFRSRDKKSILEDYYYNIRNMLSTKYSISKKGKTRKDKEYHPQYSIKDGTTSVKASLYNYCDNVSKYELSLRYADLIIGESKNKQDINNI